MTSTHITPPSPASAVKSDSDPFHAAVDAHARWVFAAAYRQLHDRQLAEDATQTVFLLLFRRPHLMNSPQLKQKLSGWLFNTLQYTIKNLRRSERRRLARESNLPQSATTNPDPAQTIDLADQLDSAVATLSSTDRAAILLRFYQDLSFQQIAQSLNISEPAAKKRVTRAITSLRHHFAKTGSPALNDAVLSLAALHGLSLAPSTLTTTITASAASTTLPASIATSLKGATTLMAITKLQTAAFVAVAACILLIPITFVILRSSPPASTLNTILPTASAPSSIASTPSDDYLTYYSLRPNETLKLVTDAPAEARAAFLTEITPRHVSSPQDKCLGIYWSSDQPHLWSAGDVIPLSEFFQAYANFYHHTLDLNLSSADRDTLALLHGDLIFRDDATPEQYCAALEPILSKTLGHPVTLKFRDVQQKTIVLRGTWNYTDSQPHARSHIRGVPVLEIYGTELDQNLNVGIIADGNQRSFAGYIGEWINEPIIIEADGFSALVTAHINTDSANDPQSHSASLILNHLAEQTGLTWSEEIRTVRHLVISSSEPTPATPP